jgi:hypothetical protein
MRRDRLALVVHGVALAAIVAIALYLFFAVRSAPSAPSPWVERVRQAVEESVASLRGIGEKPQARVLRSPTDQITGTLVSRTEAGRTWRYAVRVEPAAWRDITLSYQTVKDGDGLAVQADFRHAGGSSRFHLGKLAAGDPAHSSARFPGFFLHAAYIKFPLQPGQTLTWQWPWRDANQPAKAGRIKRYQGRVAGWQMLKVPAGEYNTVRIDATLQYIEDGKVRASVRETLWLAPRVLQTVRVEREGRSPDEAATRIVAELAEFK